MLEGLRVKNSSYELIVCCNYLKEKKKKKALIKKQSQGGGLAGRPLNLRGYHAFSAPF